VRLNDVVQQGGNTHPPLSMYRQSHISHSLSTNSTPAIVADFVPVSLSGQGMSEQAVDDDQIPINGEW
jgi:hypothetical protein